MTCKCRFKTISNALSLYWWIVVGRKWKKCVSSLGRRKAACKIDSKDAVMMSEFTANLLCESSLHNARNFFLYFFCSCTMSQTDCLGLLVIVMETWIYQYCTRWQVDSFKWTNQLWANIDPLFESASSSLQSAVNTLVKCFRKLIFELITNMICPLFDSVLDVTYIGFIINEWWFFVPVNSHGRWIFKVQM